MAAQTERKPAGQIVRSVLFWTATATAGGLIGSGISGAISNHYEVQRARFDTLKSLASTRFQVTPEWKSAGCSDVDFFKAINEAEVMFNYSPAVRDALRRFRTETEASDREVLADILEAMMEALHVDVVERAALITPLTPVRVTNC